MSKYFISLLGPLAQAKCSAGGRTLFKPLIFSLTLALFLDSKVILIKNLAEPKTKSMDQLAYCKM